jgi:hypothetical protein
LEGLNVSESGIDSFLSVFILRLHPFAILWTPPWLYLISRQPLELIVTKEDYEDIILLAPQMLVLLLRYLHLRTEENRREKGERQNNKCSWALNQYLSSSR